MIARFITVGALICAAVPQTALAHPHVFVDTSLTLTLNEAQNLTEVEVAWAYDDFYSLLILQDMGLDPDADGELTKEELARLQGWDMKWIEGYEGDVYLTGPDGAPIALSGPKPVTTQVLNGRIVSLHRRSVLDPVAADQASIRAYDPEFYTAYDLTGGVTLAGNTEGCSTDITLPDQDDAYSEAQDLMAEFPEDAVDVPLLGHLFAETVTLTCQPDG